MQESIHFGRQAGTQTVPNAEALRVPIKDAPPAAVTTDNKKSPSIGKKAAFQLLPCCIKVLPHAEVHISNNLGSWPTSFSKSFGETFDRICNMRLLCIFSRIVEVLLFIL